MSPTSFKVVLSATAVVTACWVASASQQTGRPTRQPPQTLKVGNTLVRRLDFDRFKANIKKLASFGTRYVDTKGNADARNWLQAELESFGYRVERHKFEISGKEVDSVYATKIGTRYPDKMFIISGHMDSNNYDSADRSFAPGANDDASGSSIVLEAARVFGGMDVKT